MFDLCENCRWVEWFIIVYMLLTMLLVYELMNAPIMEDDDEDAPPKQE